jgi:hypothetical protein
MELTKSQSGRTGFVSYFYLPIPKYESENGTAKLSRVLRVRVHTLYQQHPVSSSLKVMKDRRQEI